MRNSYEAVLHLRTKEPTKIYQLGGKVYTGITNNATVFATPDPTMAELNTENTKLYTCINAKDGSKQKNQAIDNQALVVYNMLKNLAAYVTKVANNDRATILLSGFDSNDDPETGTEPGKVVIKRVEDGNLACSAKIFIETLDRADRYKVETTTTPTDASSWKTVLDPASIYKLELTGLTRGQEIYIRVTGGNTHGWGTPSEYVAFIPR
jgi:hypothetical protein